MLFKIFQNPTNFHFQVLKTSVRFPLCSQTPLFKEHMCKLSKDLNCWANSMFLCVCVALAPMVNVSDYSHAVDSALTAGAGENGPALELNSDSKVRMSSFMISITGLRFTGSALEQ